MRERAFTLVELSIVLVILGLLVGGVLTGQSLTRAAELRSVSTQYSLYITAIHTFRDKYFALPGDMGNATSYWGAADGSTGYTSGCRDTISTSTATCNGNSDGKILLVGQSQESFRFWQHLANAGLIEGSYTGAMDGTYILTATKKNSPAGRIGSSLWYIEDRGTAGAGAPERFMGEYQNTFLFGGVLANDVPAAFILKPEEAYNVDMKLDDGKPATGKVRAHSAVNLSTCTDTADNTILTASYRLISTSMGCALLFPQQF